VQARRLVLSTPDVRATIPMLRGVWGAALHDLCPGAYEAVFTGSGAAHARTPRYVLRPAPPDPVHAPALDWIVLGAETEHDGVLLRAWDIASGRGLGKERTPFLVTRCLLLSPSQETPSGTANAPLGAWPVCPGWPLSAAARDTPYDSAPCRLEFAAPLRLIRHKRLIEAPTLPDIIIATLRRLAALLPARAEPQLETLSPVLMDIARGLPAEPWQGERLDLVRYSGAQKTELEMRGVVGYLDLPEGAGPLAPLLAAAQWLHIGKGATLGMGQIRLSPLPSSA